MKMALNENMKMYAFIKTLNRKENTPLSLSSFYQVRKIATCYICL